MYENPYGIYDLEFRGYLGGHTMNIVILGGGLSAISLAYFLQDREDIETIRILEKDECIGGLCRSIKIDHYVYDIGPHILFSKDKEMLQLMLDVLDDNQNNLRRSNQIIYKNRYIQYPFENDLSKLPIEDLNYCVTAFQNNPYENYNAENMLQFFLKTFGEGITNLYLRPYNEKIWKYDPSFMDTQMVERIPKPTNEELIRSANGETVEGYVHQLYFSYPAESGIEAVVQGFAKRLNHKCVVCTNQQITKVSNRNNGYLIESNGNQYQTDLCISTIPIQELAKVYEEIDGVIKANIDDLKYNSIMIAFVKTKKDLCGDNFAFMIPDKDVIFHRISKMDFLGKNYQSDEATYMVEITYRNGDHIDDMSTESVFQKIVQGLKRIQFIETEEDAVLINLTRHLYAYVIYDLNHSKNMNSIREYFQQEGILLNGRFGNFEYWNMDKVIRESKKLAEGIAVNQ
jgi:protoporphyrinogen oxidase